MEEDDESFVPESLRSFLVAAESKLGNALAEVGSHCDEGSLARDNLDNDDEGDGMGTMNFEEIKQISIGHSSKSSDPMISKNETEVGSDDFAEITDGQVASGHASGICMNESKMSHESTADEINDSHNSDEDESFVPQSIKSLFTEAENNLGNVLSLDSHEHVQLSLKTTRMGNFEESLSANLKSSLEGFVDHTEPELEEETKLNTSLDTSMEFTSPTGNIIGPYDTDLGSKVRPNPANFYVTTEEAKKQAFDDVPWLCPDHGDGCNDHCPMSIKRKRKKTFISDNLGLDLAMECSQHPDSSIKTLVQTDNTNKKVGILQSNDISHLISSEQLESTEEEKGNSLHDDTGTEDESQFLPQIESTISSSLISPLSNEDESFFPNREVISTNKTVSSSVERNTKKKIIGKIGSSSMSTNVINTKNRRTLSTSTTQTTHHRTPPEKKQPSTPSSSISEAVAAAKARLEKRANSRKSLLRSRAKVVPVDISDSTENKDNKNQRNNTGNTKNDNIEENTKSMSSTSDKDSLRDKSYKERKLTVPRAPRLSMSKKYGDKLYPTMSKVVETQSSKVDNSFLSAASTTSTSVKSSKDQPRKLTTPMPFKFHESKKGQNGFTKVDEEVINYVESNALIQNNTSDILSKLRFNVGECGIRKVPKRDLTTPKPFALSTRDTTKIHKSPEEKNIEIKSHRKNLQFKARPIPDLSYKPPTKVQTKRELTTPTPFHLGKDGDNSTDLLPSVPYKDEAKMEANPKSFRARPMPNFSSSKLSVKTILKKRDPTSPRSSRLSIGKVSGPIKAVST